MNNIFIDLHGLTEQEAIPVILSALIDLENNEYQELEIITGKGDVLSRVVEEILEEENILWSRPHNNKGIYIVKL